MRTKVLYSKHGTFYLIKYKSFYHIVDLKWYGYRRISKYSEQTISDAFIKSVNSSIYVYIKDNLHKNNDDNSFNKWNGILDKNSERRIKLKDVLND